MAQQILEVNFNYHGSKEEYEKVAGQLAHDFATVPGCMWKIWLVDEEMKQAGGIYLFTDEFAVDVAALFFRDGKDKGIRPGVLY